MNDKNFLIQNGVEVDKSLELFGDMETYNETLIDFLREICVKREQLKKYKEISDMANYAIYAHSLKSDAKYFGFSKLASLALDHEMAGKQNNMYYVSEHFDEFMDEALRVENVVKKYMGIIVEEADVKKEVAGGESILVVDDSNVIKKFIQAVFHDRYQVVSATDGYEAVEVISSNQYNISAILLDLNMPNANGFYVLEYFKKNNLFQKISVTVITGIDSEEVISRAKTYPINGVILKPFNERDIKNAILKEEII